ncbi:WYL domain-containing protein [Paenibacillus sp. TRM 82003]|uniref:helix-turn-helix transcriptional regulator n=1 Tax=Kineococcus sp. TRM81007 TaxID=2925831 RepID=UPI001F55F51D|nr:WYL domain-containing protein [Kineococcus sp. TRM81007]MCI2240571.1 WYL domain-containing protein [Kineococcus sp. TRM81007]MCI3924341.1 WYL domain-containing protein [Paenibacillus sp. TRM 82003]
MNRTDRLHALSEELRRAGPRGRNAVRLADWLEVSTRTIKRDVAALQQAGLPVRAQAGRGGGYVLDEVATLPPVNLTPAQVVALAVALAAGGDAPYAADGRAALEKVLDVLGPAARDRTEQLASRVWVRRPPAERPHVLRAVEEGLVQRRVLALRYRDRSGVPSHRRVEPHLLARTDEQWYLVGWCRTRGAPRWFRWDRIEGADLTAELVPERDPAVFGTPPADARPVR